MSTVTESAGPASGGSDLDPRSERALKRARLVELLDRHGAERILLSSATTLAWYLDGARTHVSLAAPPIIACVVDRSGDTVLATDNEVDRLIAEELPRGVDVRVVPWDQPLPIPTPPGTLTEDEVAAELRRVRLPLLPPEQARFADSRRRDQRRPDQGAEPGRARLTASWTWPPRWRRRSSDSGPSRWSCWSGERRAPVSGIRSRRPRGSAAGPWWSSAPAVTG